MSFEIAAYYFPQYHADPRNDRWHGKGWTEWELLKAAYPRFEGHRQPVIPAWGYFDESEPRWAEREIDLAADHGITSFLYDWYWYEDGPFLCDALEQGFLRASNQDRLKFAVMWANHDWLNIHPASFTNHPDTLMSGRISPAAFARMTDYLIANYFRRPNYLTIDGEPYFSLYDLGNFISGLGGVEAAQKALDSFRSKTRAAGFPGLHLNAILWNVHILPSETTLSDPMSLVAKCGFSSIGSYVWMHHYEPDTASFPVAPYVEAVKANYRFWEEMMRFPLPYYPNVTMGWDASPRTIQSDRFEFRGYPWNHVLEGNTPAAFEEALRQAKHVLAHSAGAEKLLTINAWNEWTEGSYLLPDTIHGNAYLEAIRAVFGPCPT